MDKSKHTVTIPIADYIEMEKAQAAQDQFGDYIPIDLKSPGNYEIATALRNTLYQRGATFTQSDIYDKFEVYIRQKKQ